MIPIETLEELIKDYTWEDFEATEQGRILVVDRKWGSVPYFMRVGLHLVNRPTQAIMSMGRFLRMRELGGIFGDLKLKKIDPANPNGCLYPKQGDNPNFHIFNPANVWDPRPRPPEVPPPKRWFDDSAQFGWSKHLRTSGPLLARLQRKYEGK
jgi:hypothetical protein